jgi:hypothetical protein
MAFSDEGREPSDSRPCCRSEVRRASRELRTVGARRRPAQVTRLDARARARASLAWAARRATRSRSCRIRLGRQRGLGGGALAASGARARLAADRAACVLRSVSSWEPNPSCGQALGCFNIAGAISINRANVPAQGYVVRATIGVIPGIPRPGIKGPDVPGEAFSSTMSHVDVAPRTFVSTAVAFWRTT